MFGGATTVAPTRAFALASFALIIVAIALLPARANAGGGWQIVLDRPRPIFGAVDMVSDTGGWMPAGSGLLHTTDGGETWTEALRVDDIDVDFADAQDGWVVGYNASIFHTSDGGATWQRQDSGLSDSYYIQDVEAVSPTEAWAVALVALSDVPQYFDGAVYHTTDGGATWQHVDMPPGSQFTEVHFVGSAGWLVGRVREPQPGTPCCHDIHPSILRTTDGGTTWNPTANPPEGAHDLTFVDASHGWLIGQLQNSDGSDVSYTFGTTDGGITWQPLSSAFDSIVGEAFASAAHGWRLVHYGDPQSAGLMVQSSTDGGQSWIQISQPQSAPFSSPHSLAVAAGKLSLTGDHIALRSTDGGVTWEDMDTPALDLAGYGFIDGHEGFALDGAHVIHTDDAGHTWERRGTLAISGSLQAMRFFDLTHGAAVFESCDADCRLDVVQTGDGGVSWSNAAQLPHQGFFDFKSFAIGASGAAVAATSQSLAVTTDYGATWAVRAVPPQDGYILNGAGVADTAHLFADAYPRAGGPSILLFSSDAGATWQEVYRGLPLGDFQFFDPQDGRARSGETYYRTGDGGRTWSPISIPTTNRVYEVAFADPLHGWASVVGDCSEPCGYAVIHTSDGGANWTPQSFVAPDDAVANGFGFVDAQTGWFTTAPAQLFGVGGNPQYRTVLYHTTDGGGGPIGEVPPDFPGVGGRPTPDGGGFALPLAFGAAGAMALAASMALRRRHA